MLIDAIVEKELERSPGALSVRVGTARTGYRHGTRDRTLTTSLGPTTFAMPRARVVTPEGGATEWRSELVPRYQRRREQVDEAILGVYFEGDVYAPDQRALAPLLRGGPLSKDAVSRLVGRLADDFETWRSRDLADDHIQYLLLDG
jgi:putative transposase